jgi:RNA polymerase sigma-70 factor (ECF subfamily)
LLDLADDVKHALVNGTIGTLITRAGQPFSVMAFTVAGDKIVRIDVVRDPDRVHRLASALLNRTERTGR